MTDIINDAGHENEILSSIIAHELEHRGVDWSAVLNGNDDDVEQAAKKYQDYLDTMIAGFSAAGRARAKDLGLLDADGKTLDIARFWGLRDALTLTTAASPSPKFPDDALLFPIWSLSQKKADELKSARGRDVKKQVTSLMKAFQNMEGKTNSQVADIMYDHGIMAFDRSGTSVVVQELEAKKQKDLKQKKIVCDIIKKALDVSSSDPEVLLAFLAVLAFFIPLIFIFTKEAQGTFLILNDTDANDLSMDSMSLKHGKCTLGFQDTLSGKPVIGALPSRARWTVDGVVNHLVYTALFSASKKSGALIGSQGAFGFNPTKTCPNGVKLAWEVPYSGKNRVYVTLNSTASVSSIASEVDKHTYLNDESTLKGSTRKLEAHMNDKSGGQAYAIYTLS